MASVRSLRKQAVAVEQEVRGLRRTKENIMLRREQRQLRREARIKRADILSRAAATGTSGASTTAGQVGSLQTQLAERIGLGSTLTRFARKEETLLQRRADLLAKAERKAAKERKKKQLTGLAVGLAGAAVAGPLGIASLGVGETLSVASFTSDIATAFD